MQAELIEPTDPRWAAFLAKARHDFYHLPEYATFSAPYDGGEPRALWVTEDDKALLLPLIVRALPDGLRDATSPYGYPGPLALGPTGFLAAALEEGYRALAQEGVVSLFLRLHPLLNRAHAALPGTTVPLGETVVIDLSLTEDEQWQQMKKTHRQQIRRAERSGYRAFMDPELEHLARFGELYRATMVRRGARSYYLFDDTYFRRLALALGPRFNLCVIEHEGTVAAAGVFIETQGVVQSHLSADDPEHARGGVKKLLYDFVRRWATERGDRWFHLGGGVGAAADSLLQFKAGFSPLRLSFDSLRVVTRQADFDRLVAAAKAATPADDDAEAFFPPYRRP